MALCAWAACAAGQGAKAPKIGYLGMLGEPAAASPFLGAFTAGLRQLGYVPGHNVALEVRRYGGENELRDAIAELVRMKVDVIVVGPPLGAAAARQATKEIPIVCGSCGDPVENGLAASLARPGGNVTGLASLSAELIGKRIGLMKEMFPAISRVAVFTFPANPGTPPTLRALDEIAVKQGLELQRFEVRAPADFERAFQAAANAGLRAVVLQDDPITRSSRARIAELGLRHHMAISTGLLEVAEAGALMAYGPDRVEMFRRAATITDKILRGAKPGELPFEQVAKLELVLNVKTAKALGMTIPQSLLLRADRVIADSP